MTAIPQNSFIDRVYREWTVAPRVLVSFAVVLFIGAANAWVSLEGIRRVSGENAMVARTHEVVSQIHLILESLGSMETASRGFAITGRDVFLEPYRKYAPGLGEQLEKLKTLLQDDPDQGVKLAQLDSLVKEKTAFMGETIRTRRNKGREAALGFIVKGWGPGQMDDLRNLLDAMGESGGWGKRV